ncbi:MAG: hypothetical protein SWK76_17075 [Actinomycetota bacterium]|nr:hypothetical protein [Actinomycetota bacterium]
MNAEEITRRIDYLLESIVKENDESRRRNLACALKEYLLTCLIEKNKEMLERLLNGDNQ